MLEGCRKKGVKSQISIEFLTFLGISTVLLLVFVAANVDDVIRINKEREKLVVDDIAYYIQAELFIAYNAYDGFSREFELPEKASNRNYSISVDETILIVNTDEFTTILKIPRFIGNLSKSNNKIKKVNEKLYIN